MMNPCINAHDVDSGTAHLWTRNNDRELISYFKCKDLLICPNCEILVGDIDEFRQNHKFAGPFRTNKKQLYAKCKLLFDNIY
jgi:hypothetical protein